MKGRKQTGLHVVLLGLLGAGLLSVPLGAQGIDDPYREYRPQSVTAWRRAATIHFPDGSGMEVLLRRTPALVGPLTASLAGEYAQLRKAIQNKNGDAAFALYKGLKRCRLAQQPKYASEATLKAYCEGITPEQLAEETTWLTVAENAGVAWAMLERAMRTAPSPERLKAWEAFWRAGSINALAWIAKAHREGWAGNQKPDRVAAYAYSYLHYHLQRVALESVNGGPGRTKFVEGEAALLKGWAAELTPVERERAMEIAKRVLSQSEACCFIG
jgi:hypothetical protein